MRPSRVFRLPIFASLAVATTQIAAAQPGAATVNGVSINYEIAGKGAPLVLIHGWSLDMRMWDPQVAELSRHFKVIRYDRRGFGQSTGDEDLSWDAADLKALLDTLGVARAHIIAMSQGARVAFRFARDYPDRVASLVLHSAVPPSGFGIPWNGADKVPFDDYARIAQSEGLDEFRRKWAMHPLMQLPPEQSKARALRSEMIRGYRGGRLLNAGKPSGPDRMDTMEDLSRLTVPVLVVIGEHDPPYIDLVGRVLAYYIHRARLSVIPGGWHLSNLTAPARYNAAVTAFLQSLDM